jgi:hypothetical protein
MVAVKASPPRDSASLILQQGSQFGQSEFEPPDLPPKGLSLDQVESEDLDDAQEDDATDKDRRKENEILDFFRLKEPDGGKHRHGETEDTPKPDHDCA